MHTVALPAISVLLFMAVSASAQTNSRPAATDTVLNVKLNYTGAGTVDEKHKIYVLVFDSDPFTAENLAEIGAKPAKASADGPKTTYVLARQGAAAKNQTVSFKALPASPVYVAAFFDQSGTYDGRNDPGHASPSGLYGKPGKPDPVQLTAGKPTEVTVAFDDSTKTP